MKRVRLTPSRLVEVRALMAEDMERRASEAEGVPFVQRTSVAAWARGVLASSPLWWVSRDMQALAVSAASSSPPATRPQTKTGLVVFAEPLPPMPGCEWRVRAVHWACGGDGFVMPGEVSCFTSDRGAIKASRCGAPLAPMPAQDALEWSVVPLLNAVFALSQEPGVAELRDARQERGGAGTRRPSHASRVKMLVLRQVDSGPWADGDDGCRYSHRFIVRGCWRNQAYGPRHSLRRRQWIPPYVKGPADRPLIVKETVRIWRR